MIFSPIFNFILLIHTFLYTIFLKSWSMLYKYEYVVSPNPLFAYFVSLINDIIFLTFMIIFGTPFILFIFYLFFVIYKCFSIFSLIYDYNATIDYISIITTLLLILIIIIISTVSIINNDI